MGVAYKHLTLEERIEIYAQLNAGLSLRKIARSIGRNVGAISRELKRNRTRSEKEYLPVKAHEISRKRNHRQRTHAPLKTIETFLYVREKLQEGWSPEIIAGRLTVDHPHLSICTETIYQYIYGKGKKCHLEKYLIKNHKRRRVKTGRALHKAGSKIPHATMLDKRTSKANSRTQIGHFETDLMEGPRTTTTVLSITVERKTRYAVISKIPNKQAHTKEKALTSRLKILQSLSKSNKPVVRSITSDNGSENTNHQAIAKELNANWYFCYPYHSWEKGSVENRIGVIRRYIPKGMSLHKYSEEQIAWLENRLNTTPMKCLNFLTPSEALEKEVNYYKFKNYQTTKCCTSR